MQITTSNTRLKTTHQTRTRTTYRFSEGSSALLSLSDLFRSRDTAMASNLTASSQQPFPNPQPAPVNPAVASPPTKQSLKNWAKWFKAPTKAQETQGRQRDFLKLFSFHRPQGTISKLPQPRHSKFRESPMSDYTSTVAGVPTGFEDEVLHYEFNGLVMHTTPSPFYRSRTAMSFAESATSLLGKYRPAFLQGKTRSNRALSWSSSHQSLLSIRSMKPDYSSRTANTNSDAIKCATPFQHLGTQSGISKAFALCSQHQEPVANKIITVAEQPTGIFGVPLRQSITYANVAISLVDDSGKSYIYGYVPIVVAKCGVYLKEKGQLSCKYIVGFADHGRSNKCGRDFQIERI